MSDERDPLVSQRYGELGADEPSPELDRVIVGAARRATSRYRWYPSLAAAAVLVFAVAIAFHIEREPPPSEPAAAAAPQPEERTAQAPQSRAERKVSPPPRAAPAPRFTPEPPPAPPAPAPAPETSAPSAGAADMVQSRPGDERYAAEAARSAAEREARSANWASPAPSARTDARTQRLRAQAQSPASAQVTSETPQQWLERIARLREQGNDAAAERELASFRTRYPDYLIPEAMAKRVEKQTPAAAPQK